jgi:hypothetical protein
MPTHRKATKAKAKPPKTKKAGKPAATKDRTGKAPTTAGAGDSSNTLPEPQISVSDLQVLRTLIEETGRQQLVEMRRLLQEDRDQRAARAPVPLPPSPYDDNAMARVLATTSDIRERFARIEVGMGETQRRITLLEENQRPPAPAPDREVAARKAMGRWMLANQCRASNHTQPTPAIVGRVMNDEKAFDQRTAKSPQELFLGILDADRRVFRLAIPQPGQEAAAAPEQDYVHLAEKIAAVLQDRSSIPKKKHSNFYDRELKPRLELLVNSGLAEVVAKRNRNPPHYYRFLTPMGREVFDGWPDWADATGGIGLADTQPAPPAPPAAAEPTPPPPQPPT